jgi:hypothetical protein
MKTIQSVLFAVILTSFPSVIYAQQQDSIPAKDSLVNKEHKLQEIVVKAQKPLVKTQIDRISYDTQADEESKTKTIMEMLKKVPMVTVDGNDNIKVKGSSNFKVYKNGHYDPSMTGHPKDVLKAIPASMVKRIEVITDPGAKYDAEGVGTILNIVMVENTVINGVAGSVSAGYDFENQAPTANSYITTQMGKLILSANYGYYRQSKLASKSNSESETIYQNTGNRLMDTNESNTSANVHFGSLEGSYDIDTLNLLTLSVSGYTYNYKAESNGRSDMYDSDNNRLYGFNALNSGNGSYFNVGGRLDYQHKTHIKDEVFTLSYMLSATNNHTDASMNYADMLNMPVTYRGYDNMNKEKFYEHTFQADWVRPFGKIHKLEAGLKYIYRLNKSHTTMDYQNADTADVDTRFDHTTQVGAAYAQYNMNLNKWSFRAGLRYEFSRLSAEYPDGNEQNFYKWLHDLIPSMSVKYQINDANSIKLNFSSSINRPGISYLNPAVVSTPLTVSYGNAGLSSSHHNNLSLTYTLMTPKLMLNIQPSYAFANNCISSVQFAQGDKTYSTYDNIMKMNTFSTSVYAQWQLTGSTTLMLNGSVGYDHQRNDNLNMELHCWGGHYYTQLTQKLPLEINFYGGAGSSFGRNLSSIYGYGSNYCFYYVSLQRSFLKDKKLTVSMSFNNPFDHQYRKYTSRTVQGDVIGTNTSWSRQRGIELNVSFRFGKLNASVKKTATTIDNSDVVGGISKKGK